uniref:Major facilitator superfamily (MFS) profile domain-containing protein n=1 Tax=Psilocybe cubensis TaxID=181762 RepID=A0A8H7XJB0_PSICU
MSDLGILAHAFPPSRARSLAFATFAAGAPVGAVFGTAVGGVLTEFTEQTWRSSFFLFSGLTFLAFFGGLISIDPDVPSDEPDKRIDWIGSLLVSGGLILVVFVLSQGEVAPQQWRTPYIIALLVIGVLLIVIFLFWQRHLESVQNDPNAPYSWLTPPPLMKLSIWTRANGRFAAMMAIAFTNWCAFMSWTYWVQNYKGYSAMQTVVRLLPMFVSGIACNVFVGLMAAHVTVVWLVAIGAGATAAACLLFAIINPETTYWAYAFNASYLSVMGADFVFSAGTLFIAKFSLPHEQSVSGALFNTMTQLGTAVGVTVSTVVFNSVNSRLDSNEDNISTFRAAQWTGLAFGIIGKFTFHTYVQFQKLNSTSCLSICTATTLGIVFFYGVGVVGHRGPASDSVSHSEKGSVTPFTASPTESDTDGRTMTVSSRGNLLTEAGSSVPSQFFAYGGGGMSNSGLTAASSPELGAERRKNKGSPEIISGGERAG